MGERIHRMVLDYIWEAFVTWVQGIIINCLDMLGQDLFYAFSPTMITFSAYFPFAEKLWDIVVECAFAMILALAIFKVVYSMIRVFSKDFENPVIICFRAVGAFVFVWFLPRFMKILLEFADRIYWELIMLSGLDEKSAGFWSNMMGSIGQGFLGIAKGVATSPDSLVMGIAPIVSTSDSLPAAIIALLFTIVIAWNYFKLILEIAERYLLLGVIYYTMPLAAVPLVSKETSPITKSWIRLVVSTLLVLLLNLWFIVGFRYTVAGGSNGPATTFEVHGHQVSGVLIWSFVALGYLKTAQKIDSHIAALGLTTAQLGGGLVGVIGSIGSQLGRATTLGMIRNGGKIFPGLGANGNPFGNIRANRDTMRAESGIWGEKKNSSFDNSGYFKDARPEVAAEAVKKRSYSLSGSDAVDYAKNQVPNLMKNVEGKITGAEVTPDNNMKINYKDKNGNDAVMELSSKNPGGISRLVQTESGQDMYLKDSGASISDRDVLDGNKKFNDFAEENFGSADDNFLVNSGMISAEDLDGATVEMGSKEDATYGPQSDESFVVKDEDGMEIARITPLNDDTLDNMNDNTVLGEGADGSLYRADFNPYTNMPIPEGYEYQGTHIDPNNGMASNVYKTPNGGIVDAAKFHQELKDGCISNSDFKDNLKYDSKNDLFNDKNGQPVHMDKLGWENTSDDHGTYKNKFTGEMASGEQIADHVNNPKYAGQSFGGIGNDGNEVYFDNYTKERLASNDMVNAPKYGEVPEGLENAYNPKTKSFGKSDGNNANFGSSVESLLDKDVVFEGKAGAEIAKAYMPEAFNGKDLRAATITKDTMAVTSGVEGKARNITMTESYIRNVGGAVNNVNSYGMNETVTSKGNSTWNTSYRDSAFSGDGVRGNSRYSNRQTNERKYREEHHGANNQEKSNNSGPSRGGTGTVNTRGK